MDMYGGLGKMWRRVKAMFKNEGLAAEAPAGGAGGAMEAALEEWMGVFYNQPPWQGRERGHPTRFAGTLTAFVAGLAVGELRLHLGNEGDGRVRYLRGQLDRFVLRELRNSVQLAAAAGWVVLKPSVSGGEILCDVVAPGEFIPGAIRGGVMESAVFLDHAEAGGKRYLRLEGHQLTPEGVRITNRAHLENGRGKRTEVGLEAVPAWAELYPEVLVEGADRPLYAVLKMPFANCVEPGSPLPVSLYACAMESLREIDRIYGEFLWEVKTGRRRQILDITAVQPVAGRDGHYQAGDQYLVLDMGGNVDKPYDDYTPEMRIEAYRAALNIQLRLLESQCQLSPGTFDFDPASGHAQTAAEVLSRDRTTYNTVRDIQENGLRQGLLDLVWVYDLYASLYRLAPAGELTPGVEFGDSVFEDTGVEFDRRKRLADAGYIRPEYLTSWYFGVPLEEAAAMGAAGGAEHAERAGRAGTGAGAGAADGVDGA